MSFYDELMKENQSKNKNKTFYDSITSDDDVNPYGIKLKRESLSKSGYSINTPKKDLLDDILSNTMNKNPIKISPDELITTPSQSTTKVQGLTPTKSPHFQEGGEIRNQTIGEKILHNPVYKTVAGVSAGLESGLGIKYLRGLVNPEEEKYMESTRQANPKSAMVGEMGGLVAPFSAVGKGLKAIPYIGKVFQASSKLTPLGKAVQAGVTAGVEGQIVGRAKGALDEATRELESPNDKRDILGASNKLGNEYGLGGLVLGGGLTAGINKFKNIKSLGKAMDAVDNYNFPQLRDLRESTKPMLNNRGVELSPFKRDLSKNITPTMKSVSVADDLRPPNNDVNMNSPLEVQSPLKHITNEIKPIPSQNGVDKLASLDEIDRFKEINKNGYKKHNMATNTLVDGERVFDPSTGKVGKYSMQRANNGMDVMTISFDDGTAVKYSNMNWVLKESELIPKQMPKPPDIIVLNENSVKTPKFTETPQITQQLPKSNFDHIKTVNDLPNDLPTLEAFVKEVQAKKDSGLELLDIDLQLFAKAQDKMQKMKASEFYSNTIKRAKEIPDHIKDEIDPSNFDIATEKVAKWDADARANVAANRKSVEESIANAESIGGGVQGHETAEIMRQLISEGDTSKVIKWLKTVASKVTETARGLKSIDSAYPKNSSEYQLLKAQRKINGTTEDILKQNPKIDNAIKADTKVTEQLTQSINKESEKVIDEVVGQIEKAKAPKIAGETNFPKMLQDKISKALQPKTPETQGFIRNMIKDLFGEAGDNIKFPSKLPRIDESIDTLANSYKYKAYAGEIKTKAQELLRSEFADNPEALKLLDDYFKSGFKPPHSQKLLSDIIKKRVSGFETKGPSAGDPNKPSISEWVKNWYGNAGGQRSKADFVESLMNEVGLTGEDATALKTLLDSKLESATKATRDKLLNLLLKNKPTPAQKIMVEKIREKINLGLYSDDVNSAMQDAIKEKHGLPTLSGDEVKFITETMDSVKGLPERGEQYLEAMAKVEKLILEKTPTSLSQKVASGAFMSMLGNITSPLKNFAGNTLLAIPEIVGNPLARQFDKMVKGISKTNFNTVGKTDFNALLRGGKQGARSVKRDMLGGRDFKDVYAMIKGKPIKEQSKILSEVMANPIDTDISTMGVADKFETGNRLAFDNKPARIAENIVRTNMKIGDIPFNKAYYEDTLQQLMKVNNVAEATDDMIATAIQVSKERTYKDLNEVSKKALQVKNFFQVDKAYALNGASKLKELPQILMNSVVPFAKTPANIAKRGMEYSPIGLAEGASKLLSNKNNMTMMKQREIVDRLTRGTIGTGLMGAGYLASKSDLITGARDQNTDTEKFKKESGILPDALKLGGKTFDLKGLQPITTPLLAGARLNQGGIGDGVSSAISGITGALEQYTDMPMLQGIENITTLMSSNSKPYEKDRAFTNLLTALPKQYVPSIAKKLAYAMDPFERDLGKGMVDNIVGKLPGVSKLYPAKVDTFGNPVKSYGGKNSLLNTLGNPFVSKDISDNPINKEALRLNKNANDSDLKNGVIPKEVSKDLGDIALTMEQQNQYQKLMGDKIKLFIEPMLNNLEYAKMSDQEKAIGFGSMLDEARNQAKDEMLKILGVDSYKNKLDSQQKSYDKKVINFKLGVPK